MLSPIVWQAILVSFIGAILASFCLTVFLRRRENKSWRRGRSSCDACQTPLAFWMIIPIIGGIIVRGTCVRCKKLIPKRYLVSEVLTALAWAVLWVMFSNNYLQFFFGAALSLCLVVSAITDFEFGEIPVNGVQLTIAACLILLGIEKHGGMIWNVIGLAVAACFFLWQFVLSRGRWIGGGDIWLGALLGVVFGWPEVVIIIAVSYALTAIVSFSTIIFFKKSYKKIIPLGAFMCVTGLFFYLGIH